MRDGGEEKVRKLGEREVKVREHRWGKRDSIGERLEREMGERK